MSERFVAKPFWIGPIIASAYAGGGNQPIAISGQVDPGQGKAQAAGLVPVMKKDGLFFAADKAGKKVDLKAVARLLDVPSDGDGWFTLEAEAEWWDGVYGVLVVLMYYVDLGSGPFFGRLASLTATPRRQGPRGAALSPAPSKVTDTLPAWSPDAREAMYRALSELLEKPLQRVVEKTDIDRIRSSNRTADGLTFVLASCQYPAGMLDQKVAEASYVRLAKREGNPRFVLLVGDQVYLDATAGLFDPTARFDRFALPHNNLMKMLTGLNVLPLHLHTVLDDHEIEDNWEPLAYDTRPDPIMVTGREFYLKRQRLSGPAQVPPTGDSHEPLWYALPEGFFVADTRTERTPRTAEAIDAARIMSEAQFEAMLSWLNGQPKDSAKFIASPSIFLPRQLRTKQGNAGALRSDAWDGYPWSMHTLLAHIFENHIEHVVFLSGDEHLSCVAQARITAKNKGSSVSILSVHSSGLYSPWPFANCIPADWDTEPFEFPKSHENYLCEITKLDRFPGDGFAVLCTRRVNGGWQLHCKFDRAPPTPSKSESYDF